MKALWADITRWARGPASKPWLLAFMAAVVAFAIFSYTENRKRINDLCEVIVLAYSQSALDGPLQLTPEQRRILLPVLQQLGEGTARNQARVLAAADCHPPT